MKAALLLLLLAGPALADDAPRMTRVVPMATVLEPGWFLNDSGKQKLDDAIVSDRQRIAQLQAENAALAAQPALTWKGAAALVGIGFAVGLVVGLVVGR